jgi:hypothetical protein
MIATSVTFSPLLIQIPSVTPTPASRDMPRTVLASGRYTSRDSHSRLCRQVPQRTESVDKRVNISRLLAKAPQ